jgi:hypothetical protein
MEPLRKIPLEMLLQILQDLYDSGADYVDISGDTDVNGAPRDTIKITVRPEYITDIENDSDVATEGEINMKWSEEDVPSRLSDKDLNDLM